MKVKRFKNLWTMGIILVGALLIGFYVLKIFFPHWIIGVAEIPYIVAFGNFIDSHIWAYHSFEIVIGFCTIYIYSCACCRTYKLGYGSIVVLVAVVILRLSDIFFDEYYMTINYLVLLLVPFVIGVIQKKLSKEMLISTIVCFTVDAVSQILSIEIRDLTSMINNFNTATFMIILIDGIIWRVLLYLFFNQKNKKEENSNG